MIQIYLCDDNEVLLEKYRDMILKIADRHNLQLKVNMFNSGRQLLFSLSDAPNKADIIYLDIVMDAPNGVEVAKCLRKMETNAIIIFLTSNPGYVFDSFDVNPFNYLLKNSSEERFEEVFLKAVNKVETRKGEFFICKSGSVKKRIAYEAITHFEVHGRIVTVHYGKRAFEFYGIMSRLERDLKKRGFIRCHRSILVNAKHIEEIGQKTLKLFDGTEILVGQVYLSKIKVAYSYYMAQ